MIVFRQLTKLEVKEIADKPKRFNAEGGVQ